MSRVLHVARDLSLPTDAVTQTLVVYGARGMGKTSFGAVLCEELARAGLRFSYIDPMGHLWGLRHSADGKGNGIEVLILGGKHGDLPIEPTAGAVAADLVADEDISVVIDISRRADGRMWSKRERIRFVRDYFIRLFERQGERTRPLMQILDEAARYAPQIARRADEDVDACTGAIEQVVEEGRGVGIGVTLITQRSARLNKSVAELAECMIAFRTVGPRSVEAIIDWFGEHIPKERWRELVEKLRSLPRGHALVVSPGWLQYEGVATMRQRETFDSSATPKAGRERRAVGRGARIDLDRYRARLAETIEKVKSADPIALRRRVTELEAQLAKAQAVPAIKIAPTRLRPTERVEVPALKTSDYKSIGIWTDRLKDAAARALEAAELLNPKIVAAQKAAAPAPPPAMATTPPPPPPRPVAPRAARADAPREPGALKAGARRMLGALAAFHPTPLTRQRLGAFVKLPSRGSTFTSYLSSLRMAEYITERGEHVSLTLAGLTAAPRDERPPTTTDELLTLWGRRLKKGARDMLDHLAYEYPRAVSREALGAVVKLPHQGSTFTSYLSALRRAELIDEPDGQVRATASLFPQGRGETHASES